MASRSFRCYIKQEMGELPHFIIYAILEWALISLLFIHGFIALVADAFAKFFELKMPCIMCSRIDHLIIRRTSSFYHNDSICENHKKDISSLAYCHIHQNLSNIKKMCEGCLLSFATEKESDSSTHRPISGIINKDIDSLLEDEQRLKYKSTVGEKDTEDVIKDEKGLIQRCSCCGEPMKMKQSSKNLMKKSSFSLGPTPSPRTSAVTWKNEESRGMEMPHIRYAELKFKPDNDSSLLNDEYGSIPGRREDNKAACAPLLPESDTIIEEVKTPSFPRGSKFFGIPLTDSAAASPRLSRLSKKLQVEVPESNEIENESILSYLKKQVRLDRKTLIEMYMELDEERSASAVAANNAMAMITRIQAEKAAVQMEALQYQRMMEEQAEFDEEELQVMKDLLTSREDELKVVEAELDTYREKYGPIDRVGSVICEHDHEDYQELKSHLLPTISEKSESGTPRTGDHKEEKTADILSVDFEGERSYLLGLLTELERKVGSAGEKCENKDSGVESKDIGMLTNEVSFMRATLRAIEADSGFLKHAAMTLQKGDEGIKLLTEIALHLRNLRQLPKVPSGDSAA